MDSRSRNAFRPSRKLIRRAVAWTFLLVLGRAFQSATALDEGLRREIAPWPEGFTAKMKIMPRGPCLVLTKQYGLMKYQGSRDRPADLTLRFRNLDAALLVLTARIGSPQAFAELRADLKGDFADLMRFIRCLNKVEAYLFPRFITRKIMKRAPRLTWDEQLNRGVIYLLGVPLGKP